MVEQVGVGEDLALMAHLFRRAGFGATYDELEGFLKPKATKPPSRSCSTPRTPRIGTTPWSAVTRPTRTA